MRLTAIH